MDSYWNLKTFGNDLPVSTPLSRQGSIFSWTIDQFQNSLGKDCGSMNLNELVKNISCAEETQGMVSEGLQRQGSITLPRLLSQKTVDEVWKYIADTDNNGEGTHIPQIQRKQTLGKTTLEEFLICVGARGNNNNGDYIHDTSLGVEYQQKQYLMNNIGSRSYDSSLHPNVNGSMSTYQPQQSNMSKSNGYPYGTQIGFLSGFVGIGDQNIQEKKRSLVPSVATIPGRAITCSPITPFPILDGIHNINGDSSLPSSSPYIINGSNNMRSWKNDNGIVVENTVVDKRQRRKIKNRESAARSRARKQAQTMELEIELQKLKKENQELLKKQAEMWKRRTEPGIINLQGRPEAKLRRTKSDIK